MLPRTLVAALGVGLLAFVAGAVLGSGQRPQPPVTQTSQAASLAASPASSSGFDAVSPFGPGETPMKPLVRISSFAAGFDPASIIQAQPGGHTCATEETSGPNPGETVVRTWLAACPLKGLGPNFVPGLLQAVTSAMPDSAGSASVPDASGIATEVFDYNDAQFVGAITVAWTQRQGGLALAFTLEEAALPSPGS